MAANDSKAHHAPGGGFVNPWPDSEPRGVPDLIRWVRERRAKRIAPDPPRNSFPKAEPDIVFPSDGDGAFSATWIGHSTVLLQVGGLNIITDPVFSQRAFPVQWAGPRRLMDPPVSIDALPQLDVVLLSHSHYDHLDKPAAEYLARAHPDAVWIAPLKLGRYLRGFGVREVVELDWWDQAHLRGVRVTATPARHFSARRIADRNKTLWCGYAFEVAGRGMYFAGDTAYHPLFGEIGARCGPFDFVMMPIGAYDPRWFMHVMHMDAEEAVHAYVDCAGAGSPLMLALHWGTFRLTDEPMDEPPRRAEAEWQRRGLDAEKLWVAKFGETRSF